MKMIVEMSGAIVLAAILKDKRFENKKVCAIISGGNMDITPYFNNLKSKM
jgi:threonine dehydratase